MDGREGMRPQGPLAPHRWVVPPGLQVVWVSDHWKPQSGPSHWPGLQEQAHLVPAPTPSGKARSQGLSRFP